MTGGTDIWFAHGGWIKNSCANNLTAVLQTAA